MVETPVTSVTGLVVFRNREGYTHCKILPFADPKNIRVWSHLEFGEDIVDILVWCSVTLPIVVQEGRILVLTFRINQYGEKNPATFYINVKDINFHDYVLFNNFVKEVLGATERVFVVTNVLVL